MAITRALIPMSLLGQLMSDGSPYLRFVSLGKSILVWDADDLEPIYASKVLKWDTPKLAPQKSGLIRKVVTRDDLLKRFAATDESGVHVTNIGRFMILKDAKKSA